MRRDRPRAVTPNHVGTDASSRSHYCHVEKKGDDADLRDTCQTEAGDYEGRIYPMAPHAKYFHGIEGLPRKGAYQLQPWLDYASTNAAPAIEQDEQQLFDD